MRGPKLTPIPTLNAPRPDGGYAQAMGVEGHSQLLFGSGQIPGDAANGRCEHFMDQCRLCWRNVEARLRASGMTMKKILSGTTFLSDHRYTLENGKHARNFTATTRRRQQLSLQEFSTKLC